MVARTVKAVHSRRKLEPDPEYELGLAEHLNNQYSRQALLELYARFAIGTGAFDALMRRVIWRSVARRCGHGLQVGSSVGFLHLETFEIGNGVFIGSHSYIQGRFDGTCVIGDHVWIGPNTVIYGDITIGSGVVIEGSTVLGKSIPDKCVVKGNPGRIVKRGVDNASYLCGKKCCHDTARGA